MDPGRHEAEVYPRVCGGTLMPPTTHKAQVGLSPRVRRNRLRCVPHLLDDRSIPACAGEPTPIELSSEMRKVYPRVCGGTGMTC